MVASRSSSYIPWAWLPAREFPVKKWLEERYRFRIPTPLARLVVRPAGWASSARREFPAKRWLADKSAPGGCATKPACAG